MNVQKATKQYEARLSEHTTLVPSDLDFKHQQMTMGAFPFLRSTFYRWTQTFPLVCPDLAKTPVLLAVGDLHVENFGTWRDAEGRLVWGINDFDEAHEMSHALDLVRLAVSAHLSEGLRCPAEGVCEAILEGYEAGLKSGGQPYVLAERHAWMRDVARRSLAEPDPFWENMDALLETEDTPDSAREALEHGLPRPLPRRPPPGRITDRPRCRSRFQRA